MPLVRFRMTGDEENEINNTVKNIDNNMPWKYKKYDVIMKYCRYKNIVGLKNLVS